MRFQNIGFAAYSTNPIQAPETEDSAVPGACERCVNAVISIFSDFSIKVSNLIRYDKIPLLWTYATSPSRFRHRRWRKYRTNSFERIKTMAKKEITITAHGSPIPAMWRSEPPCKTETIECGGGGVKKKSPCCASLCATRASAYQQTRYACSFWFAARFAKQSGDVYAESFSPSVLRDVHVHIADNSATDHKFLTTQITSSWSIRRQRRKAAPTLSVSSTIRWIE